MKSSCPRLRRSTVSLFPGAQFLHLPSKRGVFGVIARELRHKAAGDGVENQIVEAIHDRHGG